MERDGVILPDPILHYNMAVGEFVLVEDYITPEYTVPKGTYTDGATVPDALEVYVNKFDKHLPAAIVHDWMYNNAIGTKKMADDLFEKNLWRCHYAYGFDKAKIPAMVAAVRYFGRGKYYKRISV